MNEVLHRAIARINRGLEMAVVIEEERATEELKITKVALKKQVAKKPREHYNWCDLSEDEKLETQRWYCESCDGAIKENYSYCHDCGQAIDWRNEDD
ncbi:hypothetical protein [Clostridium isatidis]|uniref:hypothetical protein n=1 Tax=Clostridium isatidis TaxID=182773 RepID=UPI003AAC75E3